MKILVIIPAYNEQDNILKTIDDLKMHCPDVKYLVVNDCSRDNTLRILKENKVNHLNLSSNLGIGSAVQSGYRYAQKNGYDIAIQFDGDGQHNASFLYGLIQPITEGQADITIGSRFITKDGFQSSGMRRSGISFLSHLIKVLSRVYVKDVTSGMRAVNAEYIEYYAEHYAQDYPEPEAILHAALRHARILEVPVEMKERENGKSSINFIRSIYYMIKVSIGLVIGRIIYGGKQK